MDFTTVLFAAGETLDIKRRTRLCTRLLFSYNTNGCTCSSYVHVLRIRKTSNLSWDIGTRYKSGTTVLQNQSQQGEIYTHVCFADIIQPPGLYLNWPVSLPSPYPKTEPPNSPLKVGRPAAIFTWQMKFVFLSSPCIIYNTHTHSRNGQCICQCRMTIISATINLMLSRENRTGLCELLCVFLLRSAFFLLIENHSAFCLFLWPSAEDCKWFNKSLSKQIVFCTMCIYRQVNQVFFS